MDTTYTTAIAELGISLAQLVFKGTATAINSKIKATKEIKNIEELRTKYDEIINELLQEREDAVRIAQVYKSELEKIEISDKDIEHLHNTVARIIEIFSPMETDSKQLDIYNQLKEMISINTLKAMQLLGFNYKAAIGEPLTQLCADKISSLGNSKNTSTKRRK